MSDSIARPIDAILPSTYQSSSPDALMKDVVFRTPAYSFRVRTKSCGVYSTNAHYLVNAPVSLVYSFDEESPGLYWSKTNFSYRLRMDAGYHYRINPILRVPGDPGLYGQKPRHATASIMLDYLDPKIRKLPSLNRLISMEKGRLKDFQKRYRAWEARQHSKRMRAQILFLNRKAKDLEILRRLIKKTEDAIARVAGSWTASPTAVGVPQPARLTKLKTTLSRLTKAERRVSKTSFKWTDRSQAPVYRPKYYDLASATALYPYALPNGIRTNSPHPIDHWKVTGHNDSAPILVECETEQKVSVSVRKTRCTFSLYPEGILWKYNQSVHLDRGSVFSYDRTALEQAVRSMRLRKLEANNLPLWAVELRDTEKTLESCIRLFRSIRKLRLSGKSFDKLARACSGADLAYKFGADPAVRDFLAMTQKALSEQTAAWKQFLWWLNHRGKIVSSRRRVQDTVEHSRRNINKSCFSRRPENLNSTDARGMYVYDWTRGGPGIDPPQHQHIEREISPQEVWDQVVPIAQKALVKEPMHTTTLTSCRMNVTVWYSVDFYDEFGWLIDDEEAKRRAGLDRLGLFLNVSTAWELIPFSFIIDWFTNVSQLLNKLEFRNLRPTYTIYGAMLSRLDLVQTVLWADDPHLTFPSEGVRRTERRFRRMFVEIPPEWFTTDSDIRVRWKSPTWWHLITAFELGYN